MKSAILYFGNELIPEDRLAIKVVEELKGTLPGFEFVHCHSPDTILDYKDHAKVIIVDVSPNVEEITVVKDMTSLKERELFTLHDLDLNFFLKLMEKLGNIKSIEIIALPANGDKKILAKELYGIIKRDY